MNKLLPPLTVLRLERLWPHARKQGREKGQIYGVGYYCKGCGVDTIWLVDEHGDYNWAADLAFTAKYFKIMKPSKERSIYGKGRAKIGPLNEGVEKPET